MDPHFPSAQRTVYDKMFDTRAYNRLHLLYDRITFSAGNLRLRSLDRFIDNVVRCFHLKGRRVLDVGAHMGYNSFLLRAARNEVYALDISKHLAYAQNRYAPYGIQFVNSDALQYLESASSPAFDFIFVCNFPAHYDVKEIHRSPYAEAFFKAALKKLNPGGRFYYAFYSEKHPKVDCPVNREDMQNALTAWGIDNYVMDQSKYADGNMLLEVIIPADK